MAMTLHCAGSAAEPRLEAASPAPRGVRFLPGSVLPATYLCPRLASRHGSTTSRLGLSGRLGFSQVHFAGRSASTYICTCECHIEPLESPGGVEEQRNR